MVSHQEIFARYKDFLRFSKQEIYPLLIAVIVTGFVFSFRDWGETTFDHLIGLKNLLVMILVVAISFVFRISCQKMYGLGEGYKSEFQVWWGGLGVMLITALVTVGYIPLVLLGSIVPQVLIKHRLGEYRGGWSTWHTQMIPAWGVLGNLILAILFAIGGWFFPQSYFFSKGVLLNLIMAFCSLLPLPQLDGLAIFFGRRGLYYLLLLAALLGAVLLLTHTKIGLIASVVIATVIAFIYIMTSSNV
ncbi:hypothetical protein J4421_04700 [Candidatus Woesearchaeota archaeon]|nr:hypothetical protein [Candidatus Woesearchaeota archaeon]